MRVVFARGVALSSCLAALAHLPYPIHPAPRLHHITLTPFPPDLPTSPPSSPNAHAAALTVRARLRPWFLDTPAASVGMHRMTLGGGEGRGDVRCIQEELFAAFTYHPGGQPPQFTLSHLATLTMLLDYTEGLEGRDLPTGMVESLAHHASVDNTLFSAVQCVEIDLGWYALPPEVGARLEEINAADLLRRGFPEDDDSDEV
ncbi:hypothetical protein DFH09DRAFT_1324068 [Mycena vulgaris]|nr:hypothetical protein DFH09DRAFT_1324068 [Mycena vulgaris]